MSGGPSARTRRLTIVAQDPAVVDEQGRILTAQVEIPAEELAQGPRGYRVHVIDYDASTGTMYKPVAYPSGPDGFEDPFERVTDHAILNDPRFHAQNVYVIVMRTLARFEYALGRRVSWAFPGHQLKVAPHAFGEANAFYSDHDQALLFGYFPGRTGTVFSCLSHDVVAHETTHALVDGLRDRFTDPSSPDQAAFHEGFADIVALLSVFSLPGIVQVVLDRSLARRPREPQRLRGRAVVHERDLTPDALRRSLLLGLAEQMGDEMSATRGRPLRQSATLEPSTTYLRLDEFQEPHRRGEILVAAVMNALLEVWSARLEGLGRIEQYYLDRERVAEEGAAAADYLLTMAIRALDYTPPVHLQFCDFLSALLTADSEIRPDDSKYRFRHHLRASFRSYGIEPPPTATKDGFWVGPSAPLSYDRTRFESMSRDRDEVFRFVWENRRALNLFEGAYTRITSVRPCLRIGPDDGFPLRETVAECVQSLRLEAHELAPLNIPRPDGMPDGQSVSLEGGLTLIFDEYGRVKFAISNTVYDPNRPEVQARQGARIADLWRHGHYRKGASLTRRFSTMHRLRAMALTRARQEEW